MRTKQILLTLLVVGLSYCLIHADGLTNNPNLRTVRHGSYTYTWVVTNNVPIYVNPNEFWPGTWKEDTNGWRVQLCIYPQINNRFQDGVAHPLSTNLMLSVEWGSAVKNSGNGYFLTPNGKFAQFELLDAHEKVVPPKPNAGINLLARHINGDDGRTDAVKLTYETNLPAWVSPSSGSLATHFPETITTNVYPQLQYNGGFAGEIGSATNFPPFNVGLLKLDEIYSVTNEDDYTLTVQPVLYKKRDDNSGLLDRVDLPSVTTKIHFKPSQ